MELVDENEGYDSEEDNDKNKSTIDTNDADRKVDFLAGEKPEPFFFGLKKPTANESTAPKEQQVSIESRFKLDSPVKVIRTKVRR